MLQYVISVVLMALLGLSVSKGKIQLKLLGGAILAGLVLTFLMQVTWSYYIGTLPQVLTWAIPVLAIGFVISYVSATKPERFGRSLRLMLAMPVLAVVLVAATNFYVALLPIVALPIIVLVPVRKNLGEAILPALKAAGALACVSMLLVMTFNPVFHPSDVQNPLLQSLNENPRSGPQPRAVTDTEQVRVVSWRLATAYLERAYSDRASVLDTDPEVLAQDTDPTYVDGRFLWVNAPRFETWKWFGDQDVPFFVYVSNEPSKMKDEDPAIVHRPDVPLNVHQEKIEWKDRIWRQLSWQYAGKYEVTQIRIDLDDQYMPHWVIYLSDRDVRYNLPTLRKVVIMSVDDINDFTAYDPDDSAIPSWMEVVYPDDYVFEWVEYWAGQRFGVGYSLVDKKHLYDPDDIDARFLVIDSHTFWQVPVRQKDSNVLGGFVQVDTRTGVATFWDREAHSYASSLTAFTQVQTFLASGAEGFSQLTLDEGYLYPLRLTDNSIREAYIFPLYAGFTVQKYAIVDAEDYTAPPTIDNDLPTAISRYTDRRSAAQPAGNNTTLHWEQVRIRNAYADDNEAVITLDNGSAQSTSVVTEELLKGGLVADAHDEMRELRLAVSAFGQSGNETLWVVEQSDGRIVDVDYLGATLVVAAHG